MVALKWTGITMLALALLVGILAVRASTKSSTAKREAAERRPVVVAVRAIEADEEISGSAIDVALERERPSDAFADLGSVSGRVAARRIERGEPVRESALSPQNALVRGLRSGETAVAVEVDGVTGLGGFARPGDAVDVLFLLRRDGREISHTQAKTLLRGARLLTFGTQLEPADSGAPTLNARTAVLAVPEADAPRLLLADVVGTLRLALRSGEGDPASKSPATITLGDLLGQRAQPRRSAPARQRGIPVIRGSAR